MTIEEGMEKKSLWYSIIWQGGFEKFTWEFVVDKSTYYTVQERSWEAQAYKDKIINWVWKWWLYLEKDWVVLENKKELDTVINIFKDSTWRTFKDKYFTENFCAWDIFMFPKENSVWEITCQIVDSRTVRKDVNQYWEVVWYSQFSWWRYQSIPLSWMYNSIVRYDPENPAYWKSLYKTIVYDALSDWESSKRQFYFFKNSWVPNAVFMLNPEIINQETIDWIRNDIKTKYTWSTNAHKSIISSWITDVKLLELTNKDLDLLNLRKFIILKMWILFHIDPRIIWYMTDSWADRSITAIRKEAKETIDDMASVLEDDINNFYKMFINPKADFRIKLDNETFEDRESIEENQRKDAQLWFYTINEIRIERWQEPFDIPEANKPMVASNMTFLDTVATQFNP